MDSPPGGQHGLVRYHDRPVHHSGLRHDALVDLYPRSRHLRERQFGGSLLADIHVRRGVDSAPVHRLPHPEVPEEGGEVPSEDPEGFFGVADYFYNRVCRRYEFVFVRAFLVAGKWFSGVLLCVPPTDRA